MAIPGRAHTGPRPSDLVDANPDPNTLTKAIRPGRRRALQSGRPPRRQRRPGTWRSGEAERRARCPATRASGGGRRTAPRAEGAPAPYARRSSHATYGVTVHGVTIARYAPHARGWYAYGARTVGIRLPGQAALRLTYTRHTEAGMRTRRTRWLHMSAQHANMANAVGSERPRASATSSAKG